MHDATVTEPAIVHTPGPWEVDGVMVIATALRGKTPVIIDGEQRLAEDGLVALVYGCLKAGDYGTGQQPANARLIAAAPDLLQLVREGLQAFEDQHGPEPNHIISVHDWMKSARLVLAHAEGR